MYVNSCIVVVNNGTIVIYGILSRALVHGGGNRSRSPIKGGENQEERRGAKLTLS
jgi:hypothetical protein